MVNICSPFADVPNRRPDSPMETYWDSPLASSGRPLAVWKRPEIWLLWPPNRRPSPADAALRGEKVANGQPIPGPDGPEGPPRWKLWTKEWSVELDPEQWWPAPPTPGARRAPDKPQAFTLLIVHRPLSPQQAMNGRCAPPALPGHRASFRLLWWPPLAVEGD